ncbi:hypothetical protein JCM10212_006222 [Sporobolomyces blumeae]
MEPSTSTSSGAPPASSSSAGVDPAVGATAAPSTGPLPPSPSPVSPGFPNHVHHSTSSSTSTSYNSSTSVSSLLPSLAVDYEPSPGPAASKSSAPPSLAQRTFPPPIVPFDPNAASDDDEDEDEPGSPRKKRRAGATAKNGGKGSGSDANGTNPDEKGRRKIEIEYIQKKEKRHITFSKRKAGIMKKAYELATLTGTQVLLLVVSETGIVYTFTTTKFQPLVGATETGQPSEGQRLIQKCLAVDPSDADGDYISPPPDGPLLPLPPSAQKRPFEANSPIHGGQIALRTKQQRPRAKRPPPIVPPPAGAAASPLPTPTIHATLDGLPVPPSPLPAIPMNPPMPLPSPGHQLTEYPPSPSYPPGPNGRDQQPSVLQSATNFNEMMERSSLNSPYGPPTNYPPPPALGYHQTLPPSNRPPHPLDPYPHHQHSQPFHASLPSHNSPTSSPQPPRRYLQAPHQQQPSNQQQQHYPPTTNARSHVGPPPQDLYGGDPRMATYAEDQRMLSVSQHQHQHQQQQQHPQSQHLHHPLSNPHSHPHPHSLAQHQQQQHQQQQHQQHLQPGSLALPQPPPEMYGHGPPPPHSQGGGGGGGGGGVHGPQQQQNPHGPPPPPHHRMYSGGPDDYGRR